MEYPRVRKAGGRQGSGKEPGTEAEREIPVWKNIQARGKEEGPERERGNAEKR